MSKNRGSFDEGIKAVNIQHFIADIEDKQKRDELRAILRVLKAAEKVRPLRISSKNKTNNFIDEKAVVAVIKAILNVRMVASRRKA